MTNYDIKKEVDLNFKSKFITLNEVKINYIEKNSLINEIIKKK